MCNTFLPPSVFAVTRAPEAGVIFQRGRVGGGGEDSIGKMDQWYNIRICIIWTLVINTSHDMNMMAKNPLM